MATTGVKKNGNNWSLYFRDKFIASFKDKEIALQIYELLKVHAIKRSGGARPNTGGTRPGAGRPRKEKTNEK